MDFIFWFGAFLVGLFIIERGADLFTDRVGEIAEKTGASETTIGLLTAGIEWEEMVVALLAMLAGHSALAVGDLIGSSIANITGSFSLAPIVRPLHIGRDDRRYVTLLLAVTLLVSGMLVFGGGIGPVSGGILVVGFAAYLVAVVEAVRRGIVRGGPTREEESEGSRFRGLKWDIALAFVGLAGIVGGAELLVEASVFFARALGVSELLIGTVVLAIGTTLPDKVISVAGALKGQAGLVVANAVGSNIFNLTLPLGLAALIAPIAVDRSVLWFDIPFLIVCTAALAVLFRGQTITRAHGLALLVLYLAYIALNLVLRGFILGDA